VIAARSCGLQSHLEAVTSVCNVQIGEMDAALARLG